MNSLALIQQNFWNRLFSKIRKKQPATGSKVISVTIPTDWQQLSDKQLSFVYQLFSLDYSMQEVMTICFLKWSNIKVLHRYADEYYMVRFNRKDFVIDPKVLSSAANNALAYLAEIPKYPVRFENIGNNKAANALFKGVPFEKYIAVENFYQAYLHTKQEKYLDNIAALLYNKPGISLSEIYRISIFFWIAALKEYFAKVFPNFFRPASAASSSKNLLQGDKPIARIVVEATNAQVRALTKGDPTKEKEVFSLDTWRALTELDAQAKEYDDINRKYNSK